jgi:tetratricopeptide (TPR) repeat protein
MRKNWNIGLGAATVAALLIGANIAVAAQGSQPGQASQSQPPSQQSNRPKTPEVTPLTLDVTPPVSAEEDAAYKAFQVINVNDAAKKIEAGEAFLLKYPESRYKSPVYGSLAYAYLQAGNTQKMQEYGEKEIAIMPNDVSTLALLGQTLPRGLRGSASTPEAIQTLAKAEQYSKQAIDITPTLPKPENLTDEAFASAKNQTLAMAHSGLGLVLVRRGKNAEAIPELEQAIKIDPNPDPVNYYLLGMANKITTHFDDAITAFNKCAAMSGPLQGACKSQADDAKKLSTTQLSAPK